MAQWHSGFFAIFLRFSHLSAEESGSLGDAAEGLTEVAAAADKGNGELGLVSVVDLISHGEDFGLVYVVNLEGLQTCCVALRCVGVGRGEVSGV